MARPRPHLAQLLVTVPVLLVLLLLQGCFTTALWGGELESRVDPVTGEVRGVATIDLRDDEGDSSDDLPLLAKIGLTPFTLLLDCATCPVQAVLYGWSDDACDR